MFHWWNASHYGDFQIFPMVSHWVGMHSTRQLAPNRFRAALKCYWDAVNKWYTSRLSSYPFVPMVRIVRHLWQMVTKYQCFDWRGCFDDWYMFVNIGHAWEGVILYTHLISLNVVSLPEGSGFIHVYLIHWDVYIHVYIHLESSPKKVRALIG